MGPRGTGNGQGKSGQGDDPDRSSSPGKVAKMDPKVAQALRNLAKMRPPDFSIDEAKLTRRAEKYQNAKGTDRKAMGYQLLGKLYDKLIDLFSGPEKQNQFVREHKKDKTIEWGVDLSSMLVQIYMKQSEAYANALCGAALEGIPSGGLAKALGEDWSNVKTLAALFTERPIEPIPKAPKLCKIEVLCSEEQLKRLNKRSEPNLRFFVQRRPEAEGKFELDRCIP